MSALFALAKELKQVLVDFDEMSRQANFEKLGKAEGMAVVKEMTRLVDRKHELTRKIDMAKKPTAANDESLTKVLQEIAKLQEEERTLDYERGPLITAKDAACNALVRNDRALAKNAQQLNALRRSVTARKGLWNERGTLLNNYATNMNRLTSLDVSDPEVGKLHETMGGLANRLDFVERELGLRVAKDNPWSVAPKPPVF